MTEPTTDTNPVPSAAPGSPGPGERRLFLLLLVAGAYAAAEETGLLFGIRFGNVSPFYPAAGVALALLLRFGLRVWPGILAGALLSSLHHTPLAGALLGAVAITLAPVLGALAAGETGRWGPDRVTVRAARRVLLAVTVTALASATLGVAALTVTGVLAWADASANWRTWLVGDFAGALLVLPLALTLNREELRAVGARASRTERIGSVVLFIATLGIAFGVPVVLGDSNGEPLAFLPFAPLAWLTLRLGRSAGAVAALVLGLAAATATASGHGPFVLGTPAHVPLFLGVYLAVAAAIVLFIGALDAERLRTAARLRTSEALYRSVTEEGEDLVCRFDRDGTLTFVNRAYAEFYGEPPESLVGRSVLELVPPDARATVRDAIAAMVGGERSLVTENQVVRADGRARWFHWVSAPVRDERGTVLAYQAVGRDITPEVAARERLRESEARFRLLADSAPVLIWLADEAGRRAYFNRGWRDFTGRPAEADLGFGWLELVHPDDRARVESRYREAFVQRAAFELEYRLRRHDGTWRWLVVRGTPWHDEHGAFAGSIGICVDVTDRREAEQQLRQAQKMESVGLLAGGIAHDFNNLLQVILGHALLARDDGATPAERDADLERVVAAAEKASQLTRQLLAFGRQQPLRTEATDLAEVVQRLLRMVTRLIGEHIEVTFAAAPNLPPINADPAQVEQALLNLCVNARDAMPEGGRLAILLDVVAFDEAWCAANPWARPGHYVRLSVADSGVGMDAATRERIFEPFFTTKEKGRGTGLGLAVVYGVVQRHEGFLHVESAPGEGSTFRLFFPATAAAGPAVREAPADALPSGAGRTILLAEDEPEVRRLAAQVLRRAGFTVLEAANGEEAEALLAREGARVDLALLDVVMPKVGGFEAARRLRASRPDLPILFSSGYAELEPGGAGPPLADPILAKPYEPTELLRRIGAALSPGARP